MSSGIKSDPWSVSEAALHEEIRRRVADNESAVLATIVDVVGSAYRRPGAKMLISPEDESLGAITAGCLEGPVTDVASDVLTDGQPRVETFDLMDDTEWGLGLGCNGIIDILLEPVDESLDNAFATLADRDPVTVLTTVGSTDPAVSVGDRTVLDASGDISSAPGRKPLPDDLVAALESSVRELGSGSSATVERTTCGGSVTTFVDCLKPVPRLLLFGSQNDVNPISRLGVEAGFEVVVASARGGQASASIFPDAHEVVATHPTDVVKHADELTYAVIMSHNMVDDQLALESLVIDSPVPYVGLMGPRERFEEIQENMATEGTTLTDEQFERVSTPVGLDLGGGEPMQIAVSVVGEVLALHNDRSGGRLKEVKGPIHDRASPPST